MNIMGKGWAGTREAGEEERVSYPIMPQHSNIWNSSVSANPSSRLPMLAATVTHAEPWCPVQNAYRMVWSAKCYYCNPATITTRSNC